MLLLLDIQVPLICPGAVAVNTTAFPVTDGRAMLSVYLAPFSRQRLRLGSIRLRRFPVAKADSGTGRVIPSTSDAGPIDKNEHF